MQYTNFTQQRGVQSRRANSTFLHFCCPGVKHENLEVMCS